MALPPELLERCYRSGAFPMADESGEIGLYRSDPRCVLELDDLHVSRSLRRALRKRVYEVCFDEDFEAVIRSCADREETWISEDIIDSFVELHHRGLAHSVEAYHEGELAGGLYGVAIGGAFMGESMFSRRPDSSKVCLVRLVERLRERGYELLDCQIYNDHLGRMGAREIPEGEFLERLERAVELERDFGVCGSW